MGDALSRGALRALPTMGLLAARPTPVAFAIVGRRHRGLGTGFMRTTPPAALIARTRVYGYYRHAGRGSTEKGEGRQG